MTPIQVDLHTHTPHVSADYRGPCDTTPQTIIEAAIAAGLGLIAVTDHFSVGYVQSMVEAAKLHADHAGVELAVLPGVEIKVRMNGDEAHLVAIFPPDSYQACFEDLARTFGIDGRALELADLPAVCVHAHPCAVAERVAELGGICHVAHADRTFGAYRLLDSPMFDQLASHAAVVAVDLIDSANAPEVMRRAPGIRVISSSDAHSPSEVGRRRTTLILEEASFEGLARALSACPARGDVEGSAPPNTRRSPDPTGKE